MAEEATLEKPLTAPPTDGATDNKGGEDAGANLRSVHTTSMPQILEQLGITILISTYQAGKIICARADEGRLNTHFRNFQVPMGMALHQGRLAIGTQYHVWELINQPDVSRKLDPPNKHDAC